jgi:hypothetical protein
MLSCNHVGNSCEKNGDIQNHPGAKGLKVIKTLHHHDRDVVAEVHVHRRV